RKINGAPTFIDLLLPEYVFERIVNGELIEYVYRLPDQEIRYRPEDVVHFKLPDPEKWQRGHSPTKSLRFAIDTHKEADIMNLKKIQRGANPAGTLETEHAIVETEREKILSQWNQRHAGAENAGKVALLPQGLKFNQTQESNADMQYAEGKQANRAEILGR